MSRIEIGRGRVATVSAMIALLVVPGCDLGQARREAIKRAEAQVRRIGEDLDGRTTKTGSYIRVKDGEIKELDPWNTKLDVSYTQGGVAEMIKVRSAGPDREFHTNDDIVDQRIAASLKGIGEGIKNNAEETASKVASGIVKGTIKGAKEAIKDALPFKKKKPVDPVDQPEKQDKDAEPEPDAKGEKAAPAEKL